MLKPIPARMLKDTVVLKVPTGNDRWGHETFEEYTINNVHLQSDNVTKLSNNNTEVTLTGVLFIDGTRSVPRYDIDGLQLQAHNTGSTMRAIVYNASGNMVGDFRVLVVDGLPDVPATRVHHWELGLV